MRTWVLVAAFAVTCLAAEQELSHEERAEAILKSRNSRGRPSTTRHPATTQTPLQTITTATPPLNKLAFDIVFMIDGSQSAHNSFDDFTRFIKTMMASFDVGRTGARVGLVVVAPDLDDQAPPAANLNSITSQAVLNSYLALLKNNYADFDHAGQVLTYNLQVVSSADFMSAIAGYRSDISNHVLVYITTTTSFYTDPTPSAQTIIAKKQYGIITVGYGAGFDNGKLQTISGGAACSFTATDFTTLNDQIKPIQQLISNAATNGGVYCGKPGPITTRRTTTGHPTTTQTLPQTMPTATPPQIRLPFDIVFMIDGSKSAQNSFDDFTKFIKTMMASFDVGLAGARVGLIVVAPDLDDQAPPAAQLNSITSQATLNSNLALLKDNYADFDHAGQVLTYNLRVVTSLEFMSAYAGYRSDIFNHVLVYITTSTKFYTDPTPSAQTIIANRQYGIITVGYGAGFDNGKLQTISGGAACSFTATDVTALNKQIKPIQQLISNAATNGGVYCGKPGLITTRRTTTKHPGTTQTLPQTMPTATPPQIRLAFDIVFLIDGSKSAQNSFDDFTKFIKTMMGSFDVGMTGARVGLIVVAPDLDDQAPPAAQLNSITSQATLNSNLALLKDNYADFDHIGQVLTYNLQLVTSADFIYAGYRSDIFNHVLVYITTSTKFYTDPTPSAQTIIANRQYGIITVGYGAGFDNGKLRTISGGAACSFTATDVPTLNKQIKPIQQLITNAANNGGVYCKNN